MLSVTGYFAKSLKIIEHGTTRKLWYSFLSAFHSNGDKALYHFRDSEIFVENRVFHTHLHSTPPLRSPRHNIVITFGMEKLEWRG